MAAACYPTQPEFSWMPFLEVIEAVSGPLDDDEQTYLMDLAALDAGEAVLDRSQRG